MGKADDYCGAKSCGCRADEYDVDYWDYAKKNNVKDNIEKFKHEYLCKWIKDDSTLNPMETCLLYLYTQVYRENLNDRDLLAHQINRICHELDINSEKMLEFLPSGKLRPKKFSKYINNENIPEIYKSEYNQIYEIYSKIAIEDRKRQEEREKERWTLFF